jgi:hypothetical protein
MSMSRLMHVQQATDLARPNVEGHRADRIIPANHRRLVAGTGAATSRFCRIMR